jgi:hypothetical protein
MSDCSLLAGSRMGLYATRNGVPVLKEAVFRQVQVTNNED